MKERQEQPLCDRVTDPVLVAHNIGNILAITKVEEQTLDEPQIMRFNQSANLNLVLEAVTQSEIISQFNARVRRTALYSTALTLVALLEWSTGGSTGSNKMAAGENYGNQAERNMTQHNMVLNPSLQVVLSCLDVQLEEELIRYRRQKAKARSQTSKGKNNPLAALDLSAFTPSPLRQTSTTDFALKPAAPSHHPEMDPSILSAPLSAPRSETPPVSHPDRDSSSSEHPLTEFADLADVARAALDRYSALLDDSPLEQSQIEADMAAFAQSVAVTPIAAESPEVDPSVSQDDAAEQTEFGQTDSENYVILTNTYTVQPVSWSEALSSEDEPTVLEVNPTNPLEIVEAIDLPPELSETELLALGASLAIVEAEEMAWPDYEVSDEDDLWPDELDEEPWGLVATDALPPQDEDHGVVETPSDLTVPISDAIASPGILEDVPADSHSESLFPENFPEALESSADQPVLSPGLPRANSPYPTRGSRLVPVGHHVPQPLKPVGLQGNALKPLTDGGYLASSEALLDSLDEEEGSQDWAKKLSNLFTPQGIGSALLLVFSALAISMVLLNPTLVNHWKLGRLGGSPSPESAGEVVPEIVVEDDTQEPSAYDPSSQEFLDLDLGNLSKVKPKDPVSDPALPALLPPQPDSASSALEGNTGTETEMFSNLRESLIESSETSVPTETFRSEPQPPVRSSAAAVSAPSLPRSTAAPRAAAPPQPPQPTILEQPAPIAPPVVPSSGSQASGESYVVITPYTSDRLLDQSQSIVPNAYLKNTEQGANIQFGVFNDPDAAAALAEQLQQEGIPVEVVPAEP
ncbi:MAG: hypothetical protein ACO3EZ_09960 [Prochlorotrichaceae cyanobacterium]